MVTIGECCWNKRALWVELIEKYRKRKTRQTGFYWTALWKQSEKCLHVAHINNSFSTYRTIIEWCPTHGNGWKTRWLWASRLYVTYTISCTRTIHVNGWTRWICARKTASCCCMRWCRRSISLGCCGRCLIIVHNCKFRQRQNYVDLRSFLIHKVCTCAWRGWGPWNLNVWKLSRRACECGCVCVLVHFVHYKF